MARLSRSKQESLYFSSVAYLQTWLLSVSVILPRVSCIAGEAKLLIMLSSTDTIQYRVTFLVGVRYLTVRGSLVAQGTAQVAQHLSAYQGDFSVTCSH